ncbi:hypothetical protein [Nostoc sp.]|uniref:hypothetical protein n=1 Tax=Nostoc sp. TaxID=1180 RepID=UPI002FF0059B
MINVNFSHNPDNSIFWEVGVIDIIYGFEDYLIDCGLTESRAEAEVQVKKALESYFEEYPSAKEKYKNLDLNFEHINTEDCD